MCFLVEDFLKKFDTERTLCLKKIEYLKLPFSYTLTVTDWMMNFLSGSFDAVLTVLTEHSINPVILGESTLIQRNNCCIG